MNYKEKMSIIELLGLCLEINSRGNYTIFFDFSGHISFLTIRVSKGEGTYKNMVYRNLVGWDDEVAMEECAKKLKEFLD